METEKNKIEYGKKLGEIMEYAKIINEEVNRVIIMVNALKKVKNVDLDIVLDIACRTDDVVSNVVNWVLVVVGPKHRMGWMLAVLF